MQAGQGLTDAAAGMRSFSFFAFQLCLQAGGSAFCHSLSLMASVFDTH